MNTSGIDRRNWIKGAAAASAAAAAAQLFPGISFGARIPAGNIQNVAWKKSPCRFCGTGCGLLIGISNGKAVAVKGDPESAVNKGLCCVKGYHSVMALYGADRLTKALVRRDGKLVPVPIG
jgi:nitrate reductase NapA